MHCQGQSNSVVHRQVGWRRGKGRGPRPVLWGLAALGENFLEVEEDLLEFALEAGEEGLDEDLLDFALDAAQHVLGFVAHTAGEVLTEG